jgi:hypothetical protein
MEMNNSLAWVTIYTAFKVNRIYDALLPILTGARPYKVLWLYITYTVVALVYFMYLLPEDGHRSGPNHVVSSAQ